MSKKSRNEPGGESAFAGFVGGEGIAQSAGDGGIVRIGGRDYLLVPVDALRELGYLTHTPFTAEEDAEDLAALRATDEALQRGETTFPDAVVGEIIEAGSPFAPLRRWRGLTQAEIAARTGIVQSHYSAIETGRRRGGLETLRAIAKVLDVPLSVLIDD